MRISRNEPRIDKLSFQVADAVMWFPLAMSVFFHDSVGISSARANPK
jgi:hypothetical protein